MTRQRNCKYGTARQKVLDSVSSLGFCSTEAVIHDLRTRVRPATVRARLTDLVREGTVDQPAKGIFCLAGKSRTLNRVEQLEILRPADYEIARYMTKLHKPELPGLLAVEIKARLFYKLQLSHLSILRHLRDMRRDHIVLRVDGTDKAVMLQQNWADEIRSHLKAKKAAALSADPAPTTPTNDLDPELADLLS